jgi:hypothetical protein
MKDEKFKSSGVQEFKSSKVESEWITDSGEQIAGGKRCAARD